MSASAAHNAHPTLEHLASLGMNTGAMNSQHHGLNSIGGMVDGQVMGSNFDGGSLGAAFSNLGTTPSLPSACPPPAADFVLATS